MTVSVSVELTGYRRYSTINNTILSYQALKSDINRFTVKTVEPLLAWKYRGDLYGLLVKLNVHPSLFLPTLILNDLTSPFDYNGLLLDLKIANPINMPNV